MPCASRRQEPRTWRQPLHKRGQHLHRITQHRSPATPSHGGSSFTGARLLAMLAQIPARLLQPIPTLGTTRHRGFACTPPASWNSQLGLRHRPTSGTSSMSGCFAAAAPGGNEKSGWSWQTQCTSGHAAADPSSYGPARSRYCRLSPPIRLLKLKKKREIRFFFRSILILLLTRFRFTQ